MAVTLNANTSTGFVATSDLSGAMTLQTAGNSALHITNTQNIGIGTTSPNYPLHLYTNTLNKTTLFLQNYNTYTGTGMAGEGPVMFQNTNNTNNNMSSISNYDANGYINSQIHFINVDHSGSGSIAFATRTGGSYAERMRIDASGNVMIGTTGTTGRFEVYKSDSVGQCVMILNNPEAQGTGTRISFRQTGEQAYFSSLYSGGWNLYARSGSSGGVVLAQNATSWTSTSDERLKNITGTYSNALTDIAQIQAVKFTWKSDEFNTPQVGVTAQSVQNIVPEAITSCKMIDGDETEYLGVRYTELIPLMIASIQELKAIVDAQATEIAELKSKVGP